MNWDIMPLWNWVALFFLVVSGVSLLIWGFWSSRERK